MRFAIVQPTQASTPAATVKNHHGMPGTIARIIITPAAEYSTPGRASNCWLTWSSRSPDSPMRVTRMAAAADSSSAGIWPTRPSPIVSSAYTRNASASGRSCISAPMATPPIRLMIRIRIDAMASPRTNLEAPSIAP